MDTAERLLWAHDYLIKALRILEDDDSRDTVQARYLLEESARQIEAMRPRRGLAFADQLLRRR